MFDLFLKTLINNKHQQNRKKTLTLIPITSYSIIYEINQQLLQNRRMDDQVIRIQQHIMRQAHHLILQNK